LSNQQPFGGQPPYQGPPPQYAPPPPQYGAPQYPPPPPYQYGGVPPQQGGPGFGWGPPQFGGPPPPKKSKAWIAIPIVAGVAVLVGLWMFSVLNQQDEPDNYSQPEPTWTYTPSTPVGTEGPFPTTKPTAPKPTAPKPTKTTAPPRQPTDWEVVSRDKIYSTGAQASVGCKEPKARASNLAGARSYYLQVKACLDRIWPKQVRAAGDTFRSPSLIAMSGPAQSPCGGSSPSSFYCPVNNTIYMDAVGDIQSYGKYKQTYQRTFLRADMVDTVAHEYGHAVQEMTDILPSYYDLSYEATTQAKKLELSRRLEIQATCFGAVFIGANKNSYPMTGSLQQQWTWLTAHSGDEYGTQRDHGSEKIQPYWVNRGFYTRNVNLCNTWLATSDKVR